MHVESLSPGTKLYHGTRAGFEGLPRIPAMFGVDPSEVIYYTRTSWHQGPSPRVIEAAVTSVAGPWLVGRRWSDVAAQMGVPTTEQAINAALLAGGYAGWLMKGAGRIGAVTVVDPDAVRFVRSIEVDPDEHLRMAARVAQRWIRRDSTLI